MDFPKAESRPVIKPGVEVFVTNQLVQPAAGDSDCHIRLAFLSISGLMFSVSSSDKAR
jgi:hypothetical protein